MDVWEELDDYPKVVSVVFSYVKAVSSDCLRLVGVWFRVSKRRVFSSMISFSVERERECYRSKLRFRIRVWKDNVLDSFIFGGSVIRLL